MYKAKFNIEQQKSRRIRFTSAMSLLVFDDVAGSSTGNGYLDIVDFILHGWQNLRELYRRVAFNIMYGNNDDHFRNHGFLLTPKLAGHSLLHTTSILEQSHITACS